MKVSSTLAAGLLTLLVILTSTPAAWPQARVWRIGAFHVGLDHVPPSLEPLRQTLKTLGYEEGKNLRFDWRNLPDEDAAREAARQFVRDRVDLIVAFENQTARAARAATAKIPIVFVHVTDPVVDGFVESYARPGGNATGFAGLGAVPAKELEILKEVVPGLRRLLVLSDPQDPAMSRRLAEARRAADVLKIKLIEREASDAADLERVFGAIKRGDIDGVTTASFNLRTKFTSLLIRLAADKQLPLYVHRKEWVEQGALCTYAPDLAAVGPHAAGYIDRILKGAKPNDLPVEQLSQFKLIINLRTAKTLGLTVPRAVLLRADELIQ
jgi:putative ABC transport system substrate-binding protein